MCKYLVTVRSQVLRIIGSQGKEPENNLLLYSIIHPAYIYHAYWVMIQEEIKAFTRNSVALHICIKIKVL